MQAAEQPKKVTGGAFGRFLNEHLVALREGRDLDPGMPRA